MVAERRALKRLPADETPGCGSRYFHPHGYVICQRKRTWSERVGAMRGANIAGALVWWEIHPHVSACGDTERFLLFAHRSSYVATADTLRSARQWCDDNPRQGWI